MPNLSGSLSISGSLILFDGTNTVNFTATGSSANFTSSFANTSGCTNKVNIFSTASGDTNMFVTLVPDLSTGCQYTYVDQQLRYDAVTNLLYTTAEYAINATTATSTSYALNATSASHARTASYVNTLNQNVTVNGNVTASGDIRLTTAGNAVVRPIIDLVPNGTASFNPNSTNTTAYADYGINVISTSNTSSNCFRLPQTPTKGKTVTLINKSGMDVFVFPSVVGGSINGTIDGYFSIPSDGKSYSLDCYENPLPGGWSITNGGSSTSTNLITNVITFNCTGSNKYLNFVNDSYKSSGSNYVTAMRWGGLQYPQYDLTKFQNSVRGHIYSDYFPGQDIWTSVNTMTIYTNLSGSYDNNGLILPFINNPTTLNFSTTFHVPGNNYLTDLYMVLGYQQPWGDPLIDQSVEDFRDNVIIPWYNSHPGTGFGSTSNQNSVQLNSCANLGFGYDQSIVPGICTPSLINPYVSENPGDPGTVTFNIPNIPIPNLGWYGAFSGQANPSLRMLGRNFIGTYAHPYLGNFDVYYNMDFASIIRPYVYDSLSNDVTIPNFKIQVLYNVSY
jgi:hypothetical protein